MQVWSIVEVVGGSQPGIAKSNRMPNRLLGPPQISLVMGNGRPGGMSSFSTRQTRDPAYSCWEETISALPSKTIETEVMYSVNGRGRGSKNEGHGEGSVAMRSPVSEYAVLQYERQYRCLPIPKWRKGRTKFVYCQTCGWRTNGEQC